MAKEDRRLVLEPPGELRFKGPFTEIVTAYLKLSNPCDKRICFKTKTTAPGRYCVRPNQGILERNASVTVAVLLQPFEYNPGEKNRNKLMVEWVVAPDGQIDREQLWKDAPPGSLMDTKLRCVFEMPGSSPPQKVDILDQRLVLESPGVLRFKGPFSEVVTADLKLFNRSDKQVCFRVKTTAPRRYCVRPNQGILERNASVTVAILLQPFEYNPGEKINHKFKIQSIIGPEGLEQDQLWKDVQTGSFMEAKLLCVFEMPENTLPAQAQAQKTMLEEEKATVSDTEVHIVVSDLLL